MSSSVELPSFEEPEPCSWRIRVAFPDDDEWCYVLNEAPHIFEGKVKEFCNEADAQRYACENGFKDYSVEKINQNLL